jgi:hypothetical protein
LVPVSERRGLLLLSGKAPTLESCSCLSRRPHFRPESPTFSDCSRSGELVSPQATHVLPRAREEAPPHRTQGPLRRSNGCTIPLAEAPFEILFLGDSIRWFLSAIQPTAGIFAGHRNSGDFGGRVQRSPDRAKLLKILVTSCGNGGGTRLPSRPTSPYGLRRVSPKRSGGGSSH